MSDLLVDELRFFARHPSLGAQDPERLRAALEGALVALRPPRRQCEGRLSIDDR